MDCEEIEMVTAISPFWERFIKNAHPRHYDAVTFLAANGPSSLIEIANAVDISPDTARRDLKKLGETTARGAQGDRLVEKVRLEDRKGLFFQLTARGRVAVKEVAEAIEEDENPDFYSFADDEDGGMMGEWMAARSFVRG